MKTKICTKCGIEKELSEYCNRYNQCKKCMREYHRKYYQANKKRCVERDKKYRQANREKVLKRHKKYYQANKEMFNEHNKKYNHENKEKRKQYRTDLKEPYVKLILIAKGIPEESITLELIEFERVIITAKRELKKYKQLNA